MTREELLNNLLQIQPRIKRLSNLQSQQVKLSAQFQREKAQLSVSGMSMAKIIVSALIATTYGTSFVGGLLQGETSTMFMIIAVAAVCAIGYKVTWKRRLGFKNAMGQEIKSAFRSTIAGDYSSEVLLRQARQEGVESFFRWLPYLFAFVLVGLALIGLVMVYMFFAYGTILEKLLIIAVFVGIFLAVMMVIKAKNKQIEKQNEKIRAQNDEINRQYWALVDAQESEAQKARAMGKGWYPESYYTVAAVSFFIKALRDYRADSMKELVNLFVEDGHRKRMEQSQAQMRRDIKNILNTEQQVLNELQYANVLNVMQLDMLARIDYTTQSINRAAQETAYQAGQAAVHTQQTRDAVNNLRKK